MVGCFQGTGVAMVVRENGREGVVVVKKEDSRI
jgi:hypothetical protein